MKKHLDNFGDRKIHILFEFVDGPWGGGNQFLKSLKNEFVRMGIYEEVAEKADVILLNSHHQIEEVKKIKQMFPTKIFLHRIDGPISLTRGNDEQTDKLIFDLNNSIADISIFQSIWSFTKTLKLGFIPLNPF